MTYPGPNVVASTVVAVPQADGSAGMAAFGGVVWIVTSVTGTLHIGRWDGSTWNPTWGSYPSGFTTSDLWIEAGVLYVTSGSFPGGNPRNLISIDVTTGTLTTVDTETTPTALDNAGGSFTGTTWFTSGSGNTYDGTIGAALTASIPAEAMAQSNDGDYWVPGTGVIARYHPGASTPWASYTVPGTTVLTRAAGDGILFYSVDGTTTYIGFVDQAGNIINLTFTTPPPWVLNHSLGAFQAAWDGSRLYVQYGGTLYVVSETITPADEPGYCITTVHNWLGGASAPSDSIGFSPDGQFMYSDNSFYLDRYDTATFTRTVHWAGPFVGPIDSIAVAPDGTIYVSYNRFGAGTAVTVAKCSPSGALTDPWVGVNSATGVAQFNNLNSFNLGRDGNLYGGGMKAPGGGSVAGVVIKITPAGSASVIAAATDNAYYAFANATSDGTVWILLVYPDTSSPFYGVTTTVRKAAPDGLGGYVLSDHGLQDLVDRPDDGFTEAAGGSSGGGDGLAMIDSSDRLILGMITEPSRPYQGWFLRVTTAGVATRIAGTWSYTATPPPAATADNIVDGPLGTSLIEWPTIAGGPNADDSIFFFLDHNFDTGDVLLRTLTLCPRLVLTPRNNRLWRVGQP